MYDRVQEARRDEAFRQVSATLSRVPQVLQQVQQLRKEMFLVSDKTKRLERRALRVQAKRQNLDLAEEARRQRAMEKERQLLAKPVAAAGGAASAPAET